MPSGLSGQPYIGWPGQPSIFVKAFGGFSGGYVMGIRRKAR